MTPAARETARRTLFEMAANFVHQSGGDRSMVLSFLEAATDLPKAAIEERLKDYYDAFPTPHGPPPPPENWEDTLELLLVWAGDTGIDRFTANSLSSAINSYLKKVDPDSPPSPSERIADKVVRAVRGAFGWTEKQARFFVRRFAEIARGDLISIAEHRHQLAIGSELGWYRFPSRTSRTHSRLDLKKGEGRKHNQARTSRTQILNLVSITKNNDIESIKATPSELSEQSTTDSLSEPPLLPIDLIRQIDRLAAQFAAANGRAPTVLKVDPSLVNNQDTVLGLKVEPSQDQLSVA